MIISLMLPDTMLFSFEVRIGNLKREQALKIEPLKTNRRAQLGVMIIWD